ncbi:hypothetical protein RB620_15920 [Paenibacillus sp. LHD-117]|uniref:hypothetical protein n=1 Tax=Paenibacillus sp. LHD-117 TaxID=3071412 RepID=UPI0027E1A034|nr:hypothetical protein [Paenibacillus sp. LHD-117]MDQ6420915.1 hypothetical protein [Paenibacillus sp. LHD-117]
MFRRMAIGVVVGTLIATSSVTVPTNVLAAQAAPAASHFSPTKLNAVYLTGKSYLKLKSADIVEGEKGRAFVFTITVYNGESRTVDLIDYWFKVKNKSGSNFKIKAADANVKEVIPAQSNRDFTYYAEIDENTKLSDLNVEVIKWDFSVSTYERRVGLISIPKNYNNVTPYGQTQQYKWNNQLVTTKLTNGILAKDSELQHVSFTWQIVNNGTLPVKFANTKFVIKTAEGLIYPIEYDLATESVAAREKKDFLLSATIPASVSLTGAKLVWVQQTETMAYGLPIVNHEIKAKAEDLKETAVIKINSGTQIVEGKPDEVVTTSISNKLNRFTIEYQLLNTGKKNVILPALSFEYTSASGATYPMEVKDAAGTISINPGINKSVDVSVEIPSSETTNKGTLYVYETIKVNNKDVKRLLGKHAVTASNQVTENTAFGKKVDYKNTQGSYQVTIDQLYRNPWNNEDLIQAEIQVSNTMTTTTSLPAPELTASVYLDGVLLKEQVQLIKTNNKITLSKGETAKYLVLTKIPYLQEFSKVEIKVNEKVAENAIHIGTFAGTNAIKTPKSYKLGSTILSQREDKKSDITAKGIKIYEGQNTSMVYVDLELTNKGSRVDQLNSWVGYFRNKAGMVFPAIIGSTADLINPFGKVSTYAYTLIPKNVGYDDFELILGEGIVESKFANPTDKATAYLHPSITKLDYTSIAPATTFENLELNPYKLSFNRVLASILDERRIVLNFNYAMEISESSQKDLTSHDIILELVDDNGKRYEKTFKIGEDLVVTRNSRQEIIIEDPNLFVNIPKFTNYTLNIYDAVDKHKRLLASKRLEWFITSS